MPRSYSIQAKARFESTLIWNKKSEAHGSSSQVSGPNVFLICAIPTHEISPGVETQPKSDPAKAPELSNLLVLYTFFKLVTGRPNAPSQKMTFEQQVSEVGRVFTRLAAARARPTLPPDDVAPLPVAHAPVATPRSARAERTRTPSDVDHRSPFQKVAFERRCIRAVRECRRGQTFRTDGGPGKHPR